MRLGKIIAVLCASAASSCLSHNPAEVSMPNGYECSVTKDSYKTLVFVKRDDLAANRRAAWMTTNGTGSGAERIEYWNMKPEEALKLVKDCYSIFRQQD